MRAKQVHLRQILQGASALVYHGEEGEGQSQRTWHLSAAAAAGRAWPRGPAWEPQRVGQPWGRQPGRPRAPEGHRRPPFGGRRKGSESTCCFLTHVLTGFLFTLRKLISNGFPLFKAVDCCSNSARHKRREKDPSHSKQTNEPTTVRQSRPTCSRRRGWGHRSDKAWALRIRR
jgi:hypothetical protein